MSFADALCALVPAGPTDVTGYVSSFRALAAVLLGRTALRIAAERWRINEVELYAHGPGHEDPFSHRHPRQQLAGRWYLHRTHGALRNGTYKGLDLTLGREGVFVGVLLRGLEALDDGRGVQLDRAPRARPRRTIDGPCLCVDHLIARTGHRHIAELAAYEERRCDDESAPFSLEPCAPRPLASRIETARIGLSLARDAGPERRAFLALPYRAIADPRASRKGRPHAVIALHREGCSLEQVSARTGVPAASAGRYVAAFEAGLRDPAAALARARESSSEALCALLGASEHAIAPALRASRDVDERG